MSKKTLFRSSLPGFVLMWIVTGIAFAVGIQPAIAADKQIKLRYGSAYRENMWIGKSALNWIEKIKQNTDGRVMIEPYMGGTLISNQNAGVEVLGGTVDVAHIAIILDRKFGLLNKQRSFIWGVGINDSDVEYKIYMDLIAKYPLEKPMAGMKSMARHRMLPYQLITANKPVRTLEDFKGLRLKCSPSYVNLLKSLGAEGVNLPASELYVSMQKGIVDGTLFDFSAIKAFSLHEVAKYVTYLNLGSGWTPMEVMNQKKFDALPPDIQKVFDDSIAFWEKDMNDLHIATENAAVDFAKDNGMTLFEFSASDQKRFKELCYEAAKIEAREIEKMGFPGTEMLQETKRLAEKYQ